MQGRYGRLNFEVKKGLSVAKLDTHVSGVWLRGELIRAEFNAEQLRGLRDSVQDSGLLYKWRRRFLF
jgi:hypothetical protein